MITMQGLRGYLDVFLQADGFFNKSVVLVYLLKSPIHLILKQHSYNLLRPIKMKTKSGFLWSNKDIFSAVSLTFDFEKKVKKELKVNNGAFIDVGANIGCLSLPFAKEHPNNKVIVIEPEPTNLSTLRKNIEELKVNNVLVVAKGCFSKKGKLKLFIDDGGGSGRHSLIGKGDFIGVDVDKLDNIVRELKVGVVDLIKIDVEGAELGVLEGAKQTMLKHQPKIIFEALSGEKLSELKAFFLKNKYTIRQLDSTNYLAEYRRGASF